MTMKSLIICALGAATLAGCASWRSTPTSSVASSQQGSMRSGKVAEVERTALVDQSTMQSSGGSATVTQARSASDIVTVNFNDGEQKRYLITEQARPLTVGQPVSVRPYGDGFLILSP